MTHDEAVLISAYTGYLLTQNFADVHKFCEDIMGRSNQTLELSNTEFFKELQAKLKPKIIEMIENEKKE